MQLFHIRFNFFLSYCALLFFVTIIACSADFESTLSPATDIAFVITGDRMGSASFATIDLKSYATYPSLGDGLIHTDAAVRYYDKLIYIVNRLGRDNIQVLNPEHNFETVREISMGANSNPHDIVLVSKSKAYVTRYDAADLWVLNPATGDLITTIDLSSYDPVDGIPCMDKMYFDSSTNYLFIALQCLNRNDGWVPTDHSSVIVIDTTNDTVIKELRLEWNAGADYTTNPYTHFRFVPRTAWQPSPANNKDHLFISCVGKFHFFHPAGPSDGAIIAIALSDVLSEIECVGAVVEESLIDEEITDFVVSADGLAGYGVTQDKNGYSRLFRFDPQTGTYVATLRLSDELMGPLWSLALSSSGVLFVCDRKVTNPGVRVYDTNNDDQPLHNNRPLSVGMPPEELVFIE